MGKVAGRRAGVVQHITNTENRPATRFCSRWVVLPVLPAGMPKEQQQQQPSVPANSRARRKLSAQPHSTARHSTSGDHNNRTPHVQGVECSIAGLVCCCVVPPVCLVGVHLSCLPHIVEVLPCVTLPLQQHSTAQHDTGSGLVSSVRLAAVSSAPSRQIARPMPTQRPLAPCTQQHQQGTAVRPVSRMHADITQAAPPHTHTRLWGDP